MKYYRHISTFREELIAQRRRERVEAGTHFILTLLVTFAIYFITLFALN